ncbi:MAG: glycosyltransferase [Candidatus Omnitrophica bacterium]|nr:glycosyltransferase [Candidatus Omnitrophota bacterium]MCG2703994.1 glycosyltransferase [Candidatus Omnitrophota bacterium]
MMKKILLLYISNNSGHHRATKAIEEAFRLITPDIRIQNINCFNYTNPILEKVINSIYNKVIKIKPEVWEYLYDNPKIVRKTKTLRKLIHKFNSKKLEKLIQDFKPDAVVCSQAFPCGMIADLKKTYDLKIPLVGVLTDYAAHSYWMYDNVDTYIVPSAQTKNRFIECGIPAERVYPYGIPISPRFSRNSDKENALKTLRLESGIPTILIMGGGQGLGPIEDLIYAVNTIEKPFQVIVVCGTNLRLRRWLEKRRILFRKKMLILGYSREVDMLMDAVDMIVSKPGGLTTTEALTKGLPIVIVNPIPGQEAKNTEFLLQEGVAVKAEDPLHAGILIEELLNNSQRLRQMKAAALKHAQPQSAVNIAKLVLTLIQKNST